MKLLSVTLIAAMALQISGCSCGSSNTPATTRCPINTSACGNGCIPNGTVCCDVQSPNSSSYCTNNAGGGCSRNDRGCQSAFPSGVQALYCCGTSGTFGSNDCPAGQHHCGLQCRDIGTPCCPTGSTSNCPALNDDGGTDGGLDGGLDGGNPDSGLLDPCGAAGNWRTDCPAGYTCSGCGTTTSATTSYFTISASVAADGGNFSGGGYSYSFTPSTCLLTESFPASNPCFTGTRTYSRVLNGGHGSYNHTVTCFNTGCICTFTIPCTDTKY